MSFVFTKRCIQGYTGKTTCITLAGLFSIALCFCLASACFKQEHQRRPSRFLIPDGYVGWLVVAYSEKGVKPLPLEDKRYLVLFSDSGYLKTSTELEYGWAMDDYYYYSSDGKRRQLIVTASGGGGMIWAPTTGEEIEGGKKTVITRFFVGTEGDYKRLSATNKTTSPSK